MLDSCNPMDYSKSDSLSSTIFQSLLEFMSIELVIQSNHLILCHPLLLLLSIFPSISFFFFFFSPNELTRPIRWPKYWIGQSASASVLPMNIQGWLPLGLTGLILQVWSYKGLSRVFSSTTIWKHQFFSTQPSLWANSNIRTQLLEKP